MNILVLIVVASDLFQGIYDIPVIVTAYKHGILCVWIEFFPIRSEGIERIAVVRPCNVHLKAAGYIQSAIVGNSTSVALQRKRVLYKIEKLFTGQVGDHRLAHIVVDQVAQIFHGIISCIDIAADVTRLPEHHVHARFRADCVIYGGSRQITALCRKPIGIGGINVSCHIIRRLALSHHGIERVKRLFRRFQFVQQNALHHILRDAEHLTGSQTDIHFILFDVGIYVIQLGQQFQRYILVIGNHILSISNAALAFLAQHSCHDPQNELLPFRIFHCFLAGCHMEGGICQIPVISLRASKIRQQDRSVSLATGEGNHIRTCAAIHSQFADSIQFLGIQIDHLRFGFPETGLFLHIKEFLKDRHPYFFRKLIGNPALILLTPLTAFHRQKLGDGKALQHFHTGIIRAEIRSEALDTQLLKSLTGCNKRVIICGDVDVMLFEQRLIDNNTVHICASRQPVDCAVVIGIIIQIGAIEGRREVRITQVIQKILNQYRVLQGEPAHRQNIRQIVVIVPITVIISGIGGKNKLKLYFREGIAQILSIILQKLCSPQGNRNLFFFAFVFILFTAGGLCPTSGQRCCRHNQRQQ